MGQRGCLAYTPCLSLGNKVAKNELCPLMLGGCSWQCFHQSSELIRIRNLRGHCLTTMSNPCRSHFYTAEMGQLHVLPPADACKSMCFAAPLARRVHTPLVSESANTMTFSHAHGHKIGQPPPLFDISIDVEVWSIEQMENSSYWNWNKENEKNMPLTIFFAHAVTSCWDPIDLIYRDS